MTHLNQTAFYLMEDHRKPRSAEDKQILVYTPAAPHQETIETIELLSYERKTDRRRIYAITKQGNRQTVTFYRTPTPGKECQK